jgi:hypothetical protein
MSNSTHARTGPLDGQGAPDTQRSGRSGTLSNPICRPFYSLGPLALLFPFLLLRFTLADHLARSEFALQ